MERSSQEPNKIADFYGQKGCRNKERVEHLIFPWGPERVCQADHLTSAVRKFQIYWFKITLLGEAEIVVRLDMKSWFTDMTLSISDSILGLLSRSPCLSQHHQAECKVRGKIGVLICKRL